MAAFARCSRASCFSDGESSSASLQCGLPQSTLLESKNDASASSPSARSPIPRLPTERPTAFSSPASPATPLLGAAPSANLLCPFAVADEDSAPSTVCALEAVPFGIGVEEDVLVMVGASSGQTQASCRLNLSKAVSAALPSVGSTLADIEIRDDGTRSAFGDGCEEEASTSFSEVMTTPCGCGCRVSAGRAASAAAVEASNPAATPPKAAAKSARSTAVWPSALAGELLADGLPCSRARTSQLALLPRA
mmetsp:Transcript_101681/g.270461  ORF Transcript_101681/g.270461 Transcript_101681/m.270461 type:complete len:250 (-) Transcript_101681:519-1268(-)